VKLDVTTDQDIPVWVCTRLTRKWVPEWLWRLLCHLPLSWVATRWPLKQLLTRQVDEFTSWRLNGKPLPEKEPTSLPIPEQYVDRVCELRKLIRTCDHKGQGRFRNGKTGQLSCLECGRWLNEDGSEA
jgi:hypothetical protein